MTLGEVISPAAVRRAGDTIYPILSMTMHDGLVDQESKFKKRVASADLSQYKVIRRDQLVVGFPIDEGVLAFQDLYDEAIVSPAYGVWDIKASVQVDPNYLQKFLRSPLALSYYKARLQGTTARRRSLPSPIFLALELPLPELAEQRRIAAILDHADALRINRREARARLDELSQSIFLDMFGDLASNEYQWATEPLGALLEEGPQNGLYKPANMYGSGTRILRIDGFHNGVPINEPTLKRVQIDDDDILKYRLHPNDIVVNRVNSIEHLGKCAIVPALIEDVVFESNMMRFSLRPDQMNSVFALAHLQDRFVRSQILVAAKDAVNQASINQTDIGSLIVRVPPLANQIEFADRMERVHALRAQHSAALAELDALFASLQSRAFRGEL